MAKKSTARITKTVEALKHDDAKRKNIPTAEYQSVIQKEEEKPKTIKYPRNTDLDPQLVWRGKDEQDWSDLVVHAPPLYIQEKVQPKVLIDDLLRQTREQRDQEMGGAEIAGGIFRQRPRPRPLRSEVGDLRRYRGVVCGGGAQ